MHILLDGVGAKHADSVVLVTWIFLALHPDENSVFNSNTIPGFDKGQKLQEQINKYYLYSQYLLCHVLLNNSAEVSWRHTVTS